MPSPWSRPRWWTTGAVLAPAKTPPGIVARLNAKINEVLDQTEARDRLSAQGLAITRTTPEAARVFIERQADIWAQVGKDKGIKAD